MYLPPSTYAHINVPEEKKNNVGIARRFHPPHQLFPKAEKNISRVLMSGLQVRGIKERSKHQTGHKTTLGKAPNSYERSVKCLRSASGIIKNMTLKLSCSRRRVQGGGVRPAVGDLLRLAVAAHHAALAASRPVDLLRRGGDVPRQLCGFWRHLPLLLRHNIPGQAGEEGEEPGKICVDGSK